MKEGLFSIDFNPILGKVIQRLNRFMILVEVDDEKALAHLANSGRLQMALSPGDPAYLRKHGKNLLRKSAYSVFAVRHEDIPVIVDSKFSNTLARKAVEQELFSTLTEYHVVKENFKVGDSRTRLDLMLEGKSGKFYIEVKSVTHVIDGIALFPDAPTARGRKHLMQLCLLSKSGLKAGILFSVQRPDATVLKPNAKIDPQFSELLKGAVEDGVKVFTLKSIFKPPKIIRLKANEPSFSF